MSNSYQQHPAYLHLLQSFHRTKTHLSISSLNVSHLTRNPEIFSMFLRKITKKLQIIKNLKSLTIDLRGVQLCQQSIKEIHQCLLKELRDLEKLKIVLCPQTPFQDQYFNLLLKGLKAFRDLKIFELTLPYQTIQKLQLPSLIRTLKKSAPRLRDTKFIILQTEYYFPDIWPTIPSLQEWGMKRLAYLQSLTLSLPTSVFLEKNDHPKRKLDLSPLRRFNRLESLDIALVATRNGFRGDISQELTFDPKKFFPSLKRFKYGALYNDPNFSKGLELWATEVASRLPYLEDFGLKFKQDSDLSDLEIQRITQCLASSLNTNLTHLSMTFRYGKLTKSGANALIAALSSPRLRNIKRLSLEFVECRRIGNGFVAELGETISRNMKELKALHLRFEYVGSNSDSFMERLVAIMGYEGLTNRGISNLGGALLKGCRNLEFVWLEFGEHSLISDKGVKSLCESLRRSESLKRVWLKFRLCPGVSEEGEQYAKKKLEEKKQVKFVRR